MKEKNEFLRYFRENQARFSRFYTLILTQADLTLPQYALLSQLINTGTIPMTDASKKLYITKPAVTHLVDSLEKNHLIERLSHPKDRRIYLLKIQPKGEKLVHQIQARVFRHLLKVLDQFEANEQKTILKFQSLIARMMDTLLTNPNKKC